MEPCSFFMLGDGEFKRVSVTVDSIGSQETLLRNLASALPVTTHNAFEAAGLKCGLQIKGGTYIVWAQIPVLPLTTVFDLIPTTGEIFATFNKAPNKGTMEHLGSVTWDPGLFGCKLYLITKITRHSGRWLSTKDDSYLLIKKDSGPAKKPPFPNIYDDARICLGSFKSYEETISATFSKTIEHLFSSQWNSDLLGSMSMTELVTMFKFDKEKKQVPPPEGFDIFKAQGCLNCNNMAYSDLPLP